MSVVNVSRSWSGSRYRLPASTTIHSTSFRLCIGDPLEELSIDLVSELIEFIVVEIVDRLIVGCDLAIGSDQSVFG